MNKGFFIGNLTKDPELRTIAGTGDRVCSFTIAVNKRGKNGQNDADFVRVTAWRKLADLCDQYLAKGRKIAVNGRMSAGAYIGNDGKAVGQLQIEADEIEFLSPASEKPAEPKPQVDAQTGYQRVTDDEELPF